MHAEDVAAGHLESEEVAAYLDRGLSPAEQAHIEEHLAECAVCRNEVVEVGRLLSADASTAAPPPPPRPRPSPWRLFGPAIGIVAAAALAAVLLVRAPAGVETGGAVLRDGETAIETEGVPTIPIVAPPAGGTVAAGEIVFAWRAADSEALYRLTLADAVGHIVWTESTADTLLALPAEIAVEPGASYFWHVDALLPNGRSATTRVHSFTARE